MNVVRSLAAAHGPVGLLVAAAIVVSSGCADTGTTSGVTPLSSQPTRAAAPAPRKSRPASVFSPSSLSLSTKRATVAVPHGSDCVCPTIVTGTSHGCWEALD